MAVFCHFYGTPQIITQNAINCVKNPKFSKKINKIAYFLENNIILWVFWLALYRNILLYDRTKAQNFSVHYYNDGVYQWLKNQ